MCVEDGGMEDLEARKLYQILPDSEAARERYTRVRDESGEDYIYPSDPFVPSFGFPVVATMLSMDLP